MRHRCMWKPWFDGVERTVELASREEAARLESSRRGGGSRSENERVVVGDGGDEGEKREEVR